MNNNDIINQIKNSLDIADIIGENVKLRKTSRGYMGLCPFHNEDTPSFHVYTDTQSYFCFGCHAAGNIFSYVMRSENLDFHDALKLLADRAGVKLSSSYHRDTIDTYSVLDLAAKFFSDNLRDNSGTAARAYLTHRNLTDNDINSFSLGYSSKSWDALTKFLRSRKIPDVAILDSGLALQNSHGLYDRFRGRLMFPIHDITGKIIAFGGRIIDGDGAKYINSPENSVYSKRRNLYLMDRARNNIRTKNRSILVEGYMDALRLHKCGFTESVASLGTSLTAEQAKLLSRYAENCYICYDSDAAGQHAAIKGMYILAEYGLNVYVVNIPDGKDPDEFLSNNSPDEFEALLASAKPLILQHLEFLRPALDNNNSRKSALNQLFGHLRKLHIDDVLKCMGSICDFTHIPRDAVMHILLSDNSSSVQKSIQTATLKKNHTRKAHPYNPVDAEMCALLWKSQACRLSFSIQEAMTLLNTKLAQDTAALILNENPQNLETLWLELGDLDKLDLISYGDFLCSQFKDKNDAEIFPIVYAKLTLMSIEKRIAQIKAIPYDKRSLAIKMELQNLVTKRIMYLNLYN